MRFDKSAKTHSHEAMKDHETKKAVERRKQAAKRALAEAELRSKEAQPRPEDLPLEFGGRDGPEPTRFGDWEKKGIATDF